MDMRDMICIACPVGCHMQVEEVEGKVLVEGHSCKRGVVYAEAELKHPTRMLTTTVIIKGGKLNRLPVRTDEPIPKEKIFDCMEEINKVVVKSPISMGDMIIENILDTGCNIIASRSM